jgi:putative hydrolase of the HAD superfamily
MGELCGRSGPEIRKLLIDTGLQWEFERGQVTPSEFHLRFEEAVEWKVDRNRLAIASSDIFAPNESLQPVLAELKLRGYRLVLLSNTTIWHFEFVRDRFRVLKPFDDFVLSCQAGAMKPDASIFEAAVRAIHCDPADCFYTDDIPAYIEAGRTHGLDAEVFSDTAGLIRHLQQRGVVI